MPFTIAFLGTMVAANAAAGTLGRGIPVGVLRDWGISHHDLVDGEVIPLFTGRFPAQDPGMFLRQMGFAAAVIEWNEWTRGTLRTVSTFFAVDVVGTLLTLFTVLPVLHIAGDGMLPAASDCWAQSRWAWP